MVVPVSFSSSRACSWPELFRNPRDLSIMIRRRRDMLQHVRLSAETARTRCSDVPTASKRLGHAVAMSLRAQHWRLTGGYAVMLTSDYAVISSASSVRWIAWRIFLTSFACQMMSMSIRSMRSQR